jgi:outer membrane cobalamin receptor
LLRWSISVATSTFALCLASSASAQASTPEPGAPGAPVTAVAPGPPAPAEPWPAIEVTEVTEVGEVTVGVESAADRLRRSAEAVGVVETERARQESADLGAVLQRTQGVGVRRSGGLGSSTQFSLNGFTDDQIRFFLDGVPLEFAGFPQGVANVPVNLVKRVEINRGVVPVRFGADALGGAVNIVTTTDDPGSHLGASYQVGSFGTHRATL